MYSKPVVDFSAKYPHELHSAVITWQFSCRADGEKKLKKKKKQRPACEKQVLRDGGKLSKRGVNINAGGMMRQRKEFRRQERDVMMG